MEFDGLFITTHPDVYEPHDDTFLLADAVKKRIRAGSRFLEVGCGTALVSLVAARQGAQVTATDANAHAVVLARHNAKQNGLDLEVRETDLLAGVQGPFDLVAFNPPYLPTTPAERVAGPLNLAFDGGFDGNLVVMRFARQIAALRPLPTEVLVVHSSLSDPTALEQRMREAGYRHEVASQQKLWFEELWVRRFYQ